MPYTFNVVSKEITIPKDADKYTNCHEFTVAVINALYGAGLAKSLLRIERREIFDVLKDINNARDIAKIYAQWIQRVKPKEFHKDDCADIPVGHLILFCSYGTTEYNIESFVNITHSMIVTSKDEWTGANNVNSLGINGADKLGSGDTTTIYKYIGMSERNYNNNGEDRQGGWDRESMKSIYSPGETYTMYCIPIL